MQDTHFDVPKLVKCPSCQSDVSTKAAACPKCGHQFKYAGGINLKDPVHRVGLALCVVFIVSVIGYVGFVVSNNAAVSAQEKEGERLKEIEKSTSEARKATEAFDAALHPKK